MLIEYKVKYYSGCLFFNNNSAINLLTPSIILLVPKISRPRYYLAIYLYLD